jgi:tetratricopeptide (TPR) repeat protein
MELTAENKQIYAKAVALFAEKRFKESLSLFETLPESTIVLYDIATCLKELGDLFKSEKIYARLLRSKVKDSSLRESIQQCYVSTITLIVKAYTESCEYEKALEINERAIQILRNNAILLYNVGHIMKCVGKHKEAIKYLEMSLDENSLYFDSYIELINIYNDWKDYDKAITVMHRGMDAIPNDPRFYNELGVAMSRQGKVREALQTYQAGLDLPGCNPVCAGKIYTNCGSQHPISFKRIELTEV